jgi:hypothetical protein
VAAGFKAIAASGDVTLLMAAIFVATILCGQESVLRVVVSQQRLGMDSDGVGWLFAAIGLGGLKGAGCRAAWRRGPGEEPPSSSPCVWWVSYVGCAFTTTPAIAYALLTLDGAGGVLLDVLTITMLQGTVVQDVLARVFGISMTACGGWDAARIFTVPLLLNLFGIRTALLIAGAMLPLLALLAAPRVRALNRKAAEAKARLEPRLARPRGLRIFDGAPPQSLEAIAHAMVTRQVASGKLVLPKVSLPMTSMSSSLGLWRCPPEA